MNDTSNIGSESLSGKRNANPRNFLFHLHPPRVSADSIKFNRTFGLGGMAALLFLLQALTGILLRFVYEPAPEHAYDSIVYIREEIIFGSFIRNIHHWSGIFFVIILFLHFIRVFLSQAIFRPRHVNWVIGVALLILGIFSNFTGYLLPWDQLSFWAVTVGTSMAEYIPLIGKPLLLAIRGGTDVGSVTLLNFYTFHTAILPLAISILMIWHFWKVRKAKGVAVPANADDERVPGYPDLVMKEVAVGLTLMALVFLLSALFDAPLRERANPAFSPNPAKAPWYFMGIQELLLHIHPFFSAVLLPLMFFGGLLWLPFIRFRNLNPGEWFHSEKGKKLALQSALLACFITPAAILANEYLFHFKEWMPAIPVIVSEGVVPFLLLCISFAAYILYLGKRKGASTIEIIISVFVVFVVSYILLTITGIWFRGEGMVLKFPYV